MELKLESISQLNLPVECFLSVRIGDTQKLSRVADGRVFRFPNNRAGKEARRYGRVEVFQRIGACSLDVDPANKGSRDVKISCSEAGFGILGLTVGVEDLEPEPKPRVEDPVLDKAQSKVKAAKQYLNKHGIEVQLSQAMQALLKEKPDQPAEFIAMRLLGSNGGGTTRLPPLGGAPQPSEKPAWTTPGVEPQSRRLEPLSSQALPRNLSCPATKPAAMTPFGASYYSRFFHSMPCRDMTQIHFKFASFRATECGERAAYRLAPHLPLSTGALADLYDKFPSKWSQVQSAKPPAWKVKPSVGTWLQNRCVQPCTSSASAQQVQLAKPPSWKVKPSVGTWIQNRRVQPSTPSGSAQQVRRSTTLPFTRKPSVCTWLGRPASTMLSREPAQTSYQFRASVGTWLSPMLEEPAPAPRPPLKVCNKIFRLKPSVGTWLAKASIPPVSKAPELRSFVFRPSVGTWLAPVVREPEEDMTTTPKPWRPHPILNVGGGVALVVPPASRYLHGKRGCSLPRAPPSAR
eukprot:TRINITY_DN11074_c0_g1_i2.p1 TRINITY_DN11074_c0_g1~~TRINITY_DN11074_c0_g1_i2.p1  ORF type:complete len:518 (+),score=89.26 TRINITY_DN11074_c0_g1_i2:80-1633(+)